MKKIAIFLLVLLGICLLSSVLKAQQIGTFKWIYMVNVADSTTVIDVNATMFYNQQSHLLQVYENGVTKNLLFRNTAASTELMRSNGRYATPSGVFIPALGSLSLGSSSLSGASRSVSVIGSASNITLSLTAKGTGSVALTNQSGGSVDLNGAGNFFESIGQAENLMRIQDDANNSSVSSLLKLSHLTSGTPATGIGTGLNYETEVQANINKTGVNLNSVSTDVTSTSEDFDFVVNTMAGGAAAVERFRVSSTGLTATVPFTLSTNSTAPTQGPGDNTTKVSTTAFVTAAVAAAGGTGNAFFAVTGPATSTKTFTFPNANATVLTSNAAVTGAQGGTGQTTTTTGDILVGSAANTWSKLAKGSANQILGVNNANTTAEYKTVSNGLTAGSGTLQLGGTSSSPIDINTNGQSINVGNGDEGGATRDGGAFYADDIQAIVGIIYGGGVNENSMTFNTTGHTLSNGGLDFIGDGDEIRFQEGGSNAVQGRVVLVGGTKIVTTTKANSTMTVHLDHRIASGTLGILSVGTVVNGTSFVINSSNPLDVSTVTWTIFDDVP